MSLPSSNQPASPQSGHHFRFHRPHLHLAPVFGGDWFALKAEAFARFFGTPGFLVTQTLAVAVWIGLNVFGFSHFDLYPFILLNLAFSLPAEVRWLIPGAHSQLPFGQTIRAHSNESSGRG